MSRHPFSARVGFWLGYWVPSMAIAAVARCFVRRPPERPRGCVALLLPEHIGDVVLSTPLLRAVRARFPNDELVVLVSAEAAPLLTACPLVDVVQIWPRGFRVAIDLGHWLRGRWPDVVIVPRADPDQRWAPLVAVLSGAPRRISLTDASPGLARLKRLQAEPFFSETVRPPADVRHERLRRLAIARLLGGRADDARLESWVGAAEQARAEAFFATLPEGRRMAVGLGASAETRVWPAERYAAVIDRLGAEEKIVPVLIIGPGETARAEAVRAVAKTPVHWLEGATLGESNALVRGCARFLGNDSGPAHLASAGGLAVVVISVHPEGAPDDAPASPDKCGPACAAARVVRPAAPASAACAGGCIEETPHCILGVTVDAVVAAAKELR